MTRRRESFYQQNCVCLSCKYSTYPGCRDNLVRFWKHLWNISLCQVQVWTLQSQQQVGKSQLVHALCGARHVRYRSQQNQDKNSGNSITRYEKSPLTAHPASAQAFLSAARTSLCIATRCVEHFSLINIRLVTNQSKPVFSPQNLRLRGKSASPIFLMKKLVLWTQCSAPLRALLNKRNKYFSLVK